MRTSDGTYLNPEAVMYDDGTPFLEHYGVLGMKWGVRNAETKERYMREKRAKKARKIEQKNIKAKRKTAKASRKAQRGVNRERVKTINDERREANRNRALLSDAELDRRIQRLQKEQRLNQLTQAELEPGRYMVKSALVQVGSSTIKTEAKGAIKVGKKRGKKIAGEYVTLAPKGPHVGAASKVSIS